MLEVAAVVREERYVVAEGGSPDQDVEVGDDDVQGDEVETEEQLAELALVC